MITVAGEALIDLVVEPDGRFRAVPGGAPFNVARIVGLLGGECTYLGRLADDAFGMDLRFAMAEANVRLAVAEASAAPTTLAVAALSDSGDAEYNFYLEQTTAAALCPDVIPTALLTDSAAFVLGGLGLVAEPTRSTLLELIRQAPNDLLVLFDVNCRPNAIRDPESYRYGVDQIMSRADIVKFSVEDMRFLAPELEPLTAALAVIDRGARCVVITNGPNPVTVVTAAGFDTVHVPRVEVRDTIGAGDAFVAGFITTWVRDQRQRSDSADLELLRAGAAAAVHVSAAACSVRGAGIPAGFTLPATV